MAKENEPAKLLLPYLQRADELQKHEPLVAYYCRLYAMERGLRIPQSDRTKTTNSLLVSLMNQLEKDKKSLQLGSDDYLHVEGFALNVFSKADKQDRGGRADLNTAKTFYAASIFFEILNQFGEIQPDLEQKQKYAAWKAADIRKALKEGRKPVPGPPNGEKDSSEADYQSHDFPQDDHHHPQNFPQPSNKSEPHYQSLSQDDDHHPHNILQQAPLPHQPRHKSETHYQSHDFPLPQPNNKSESHDFQQPPPTHDPTYPQTYHHSYPNFQSYPGFADTTLPSFSPHYPSYFQDATAPAHPATYYNPSGPTSEPLPPSLTKTYQYDSNYQPPPEKIAEAHKAARFAVGALAFDDVSVAVDYLKKSLQLLTNPSAQN